MTQSLEAIKQAWEQFVFHGILEDSVNPVIAASWKRCKAMGVDIHEGMGSRVAACELQELLTKNKVLLEIARPIMKNLLEIVLGSHFALVLTDHEGRIIESIGDDIVLDRANRIRFVMGSLWSERAVGTNAIGTALAIDQPVQVIGAEHYCSSHHRWTCSAAPIHGVKGEIIGCLNMSGESAYANSHTLGIVVAAAFSIENQFALLHSYQWLDTTFESTTDGIIIVDQDFQVQRMNRGAAKLLGVGPEDLKAIDFQTLFQEINFDNSQEAFNRGETVYFTDINLYIRGKRIACSANIAPMILDDKIVGYSLGFREAKYLHKTVNKVTGNVAAYTFDSILTQNQRMKDLIAFAKRMARNKGCILIEGESGTGKELFAHALHNESDRARGPFVAVNCASLPRDLMESELFGYEKGAFTGALREGNPGKFELADGGTLFLDEIGELPLELQAKLLRVVENLTVRRIGGHYEKKLDVRIIAATNRNLLEEVRKRNFREDLYFRLNVFKLEIPPLRERAEDIPYCAEAFLKRLNQEHPGEQRQFSVAFLEDLQRRPWRGNVRELQNWVERAYYLTEGTWIYPREREVFPPVAGAAHAMAYEQASPSVEEMMKGHIEEVLRQSRGDVMLAAKALGISRASFYRRIKKYGIQLEQFRVSSQ